MKIAAQMVLILALAAGRAASAAESVGTPHVYKKLSDRELRLFVVQPEDAKAGAPRPAIVFFHGGGWVSGTPVQFNEHSAYFASRGVVCIQVAYRLLKGAEKETPPLVCCQDAKSAMRWVRAHAAELGIDPKRIASAGGSAGGHLAAFVGMVDGLDDPQDDASVSAKSDAMILFNPVLHNGPEPEGWGYARTGDRYREFSPFHNVSADDPPGVLFLGTADKLIPVRVAQELQAAMKKAGVRLDVHLYDGQPHGFFNFGKNDGRYYRETVIEADRFLASLGWIKGEPTLQAP